MLYLLWGIVWAGYVECLTFPPASIKVENIIDVLLVPVKKPARILSLPVSRGPRICLPTGFPGVGGKRFGRFEVPPFGYLLYLCEGFLFALQKPDRS
jgi:hypothetical protein